MNSTICSHCRLSLRRTIRATRTSRHQTAAQSTVPASLTRPSRTQTQLSDPLPSSSSSASLASLLSAPTWSVRSLLAPDASTSPSTPPTEAPTITPKTLHHLLRLSALPLPRTHDEESQMLATLSSQLHFVRAIQRVDTVSVAPLRVIRDETARGLREQTIGLAELRDALELEDVVGHARRPRRRRAQVGKDGGGGEEEQKREPNEEDWDVLGGASETARGRYFIVRSGGTKPLPDSTLE
ncbi:hypothetical protein GGR51DRAFT_305157 [Nemania sp. FL0031]|nr:hypothetical protein GGR51DRAFT_305157 [Nemania sp. FL0031]